tara:strand:- start:179 stop:394 length:216 start_codon:yes stop_codon:yes gene_type:complete
MGSSEEELQIGSTAALSEVLRQAPPKEVNEVYPRILSRCWSLFTSHTFKDKVSFYFRFFNAFFFPFSFSQI